jgi:hypothetical protein
MSDVITKLIENAPKLIERSAQSPLALASLIVLALSTTVFLLFKNEQGLLKTISLAMLIISVCVLGTLSFVFASRSKIESPKKNRLKNPGDTTNNKYLHQSSSRRDR